MMHTTHFSMFAEIERQLHEALNAPLDHGPTMTKTERKRIQKASRTKPRLFRPDPPPRIVIELSCRSSRGGQTVKITHTHKETVSIELAEIEARRIACDRGYDDIVVLDKQTF